MRKILLVLVSFVIAACAQGSHPYPGNHESGPLYHTVSRSGETLAAISDWYTGSPNNWRAIASANGSLDPYRLRIGDQLVIPGTLVFRRDPLPSYMLTGKKSDSKKNATVVGTSALPSVKQPAAAPAGAIEPEHQAEKIEASPAAATVNQAAAAQAPAASAAVEENAKVNAETAAAPASPEKSVTTANEVSETANHAAALAQTGQSDEAVAQAQKASEQSLHIADDAMKDAQAQSEKAIADSKAAVASAKSQAPNADAAAALKQADRALEDSAKPLTLGSPEASY